VRVEDLDYAPLGFGSHHYFAESESGTRWFVTLDPRSRRLPAPPPDVADGLERAFATAAALREQAGLEFVLAPLVTTQGARTAALGSDYIVSLWPFVSATTLGEGPFASSEQRETVLVLLDRLHNATRLVPPELPRVETFVVPHVDDLRRSLTALEEPWDAGPYGERARAGLRDSRGAVEERLAAYDTLVAMVRSSNRPWVITHGEPHTSNVLVDETGSPLLIDWDTSLFAPPERDLWMPLTGQATPDGVDPDALELYARWWDLSEIGVYTFCLRGAHEDTADTRLSLKGLESYLR
jgi:spectinomycin phosphotransferase